MRAMRTIPLFPLNTVLFPGIPLHLHIFEPRYKRMIQECLTEELPFGVVLIKKGREAQGPLAETHPVGCSTQILQTERLEDDRFNIATVGESRFRIHSLDHSRPYLVGDVEYYSLDDSEAESLERLAGRIRRWVERYLNVLGKAGEVKFDSSKVPDHPILLGHLAAYIVQAPVIEKQKLLEIRLAEQFLAAVEKLYRRETALMRTLIEQESGLGSNSLN